MLSDESLSKGWANGQSSIGRQKTVESSLSPFALTLDGERIQSKRPIRQTSSRPVCRGRSGVDATSCDAYVYGSLGSRDLLKTVPKEDVKKIHFTARLFFTDLRVDSERTTSRSKLEIPVPAETG